MLSWVTNTPELTDACSATSPAGCDERSGREAAGERYGADPKDTDAWARLVALGATDGGSEAQQLALHHELGAYHRDRYAAYLAALRDVAQEHGVDGVPFLVNLHGTGRGRGHDLPDRHQPAVEVVRRRAADAPPAPTTTSASSPSRTSRTCT